MRRGFEIHNRKDGRWYARYRKDNTPGGKSGYGYVYGKTREEVEERLREIDPDHSAQGYAEELNLLILGAGTHGRDVKEIAESLHIFRKIRFLDDEVTDPDVIGRCDEAYRFRNEFPCAFIAIGDNAVREKYAQILKENHFLIPSLVAPSAFIFSNATIGEGTIIMPQTNLGAVDVGSFCIVSSGSTIGSGVEIGNYSRIDSGAVVLKGDDVPEGTWVRSGEIYHNNSELFGYEANARNNREVI